MTRRGQLVLVASVLVAVALAPIVLAYLQLGYHDDVRATGGYEDPTAETVRVLDRAVTNVSGGIPGTYAWTDRAAAVTAVRDQLAPIRSRLRTAEVTRGTVTNVSYNATAATAWRGGNCPSGPDRQFGDCVADRGVVVQDRVGRTHVLGIAFDVRTTTERGETTVTVVLEAVG